ncbi:cell wall-binding repeat-containing protein [Caloramator sp. mosi_1]|uniref:cell wall-binding repeat-containing protein n=1 Tax=Caloramator sp. mosi_1 TaxID=3023090 RepID=UPI0023607276|nr:cell wall-binding repeat-containing protein [Caloramator sp. mosi_1]WDC85107.1 cell wall-binding repeat-containing protein [Caloramator sp. mosi_1]
MNKRIVSLTMSMFMILTSCKGIVTNAKTVKVERIGGQNRYKTSANIAKKHYELRGKKYDNLIIAYGNNFPDSLGASALSSKYEAPILLVDKEK